MLKKNKLTYLGLCEGISTATVAWKGFMRPVGFAEIDEFPSTVLKYHYPGVPNLGDITKFKEWDIEHPNVIIGGTPCQSFSVAGLRGGLEDSRGNLTLTFVKILEHFNPEWFIWENVPGVFSSNNGRDFHSFTEGLQAIGYSIGWRVLDAQYFGLAQRRKRVFVVGNNSGNLRSVAEVLFERESLFRNLEESRQKGKEVTRKTGKRSTTNDQRKEGVNAFDMQRIAEYGNGKKSSTLKRRDYKDATDLVVDTVTAFAVRTANTNANGHGVSKNKTHTLDGANGQAIAIQGNLIGREKGGPQGVGASDEGKMYTLTKADVHAVVYKAHAQDARYREQDVAPTIQARHSNMTNTPLVYESHPNDSRITNMGDTCTTVTARWGTGGNNTPLVKIGDITATNDKQLIHHNDEPKIFQQNQRNEVRYMGEDGSISGALSSDSGAKQTNYVHQKAVIRRLTPVECERLQGFPDNYTQIPWRGKDKKDCPDSHRYKALGNAMAVPVIRFLGKNIAKFCI